jgi:predicted helicase
VEGDGFTALLSRLDPDERVRGRQFERICAWYLRSAPKYRTRLRRVWHWSEWPGAWAADAGIDLVAEDHGGGLWAIQAKAYDPDSHHKPRREDAARLADAFWTA